LRLHRRRSEGKRFPSPLQRRWQREACQMGNDQQPSSRVAVALYRRSPRLSRGFSASGRVEHAATALPSAAPSAAKRGEAFPLASPTMAARGISLRAHESHRVRWQVWRAVYTRDLSRPRLAVPWGTAPTCQLPALPILMRRHTLVSVPRRRLPPVSPPSSTRVAQGALASLEGNTSIQAKPRFPYRRFFGASNETGYE
jgi:hypothetical protein